MSLDQASDFSAFRQVAIAILCQGDRFLLQLRDDNPNIFYPGHWAFFGGHLEPGEAPDVAMQRELLEEIGYQPPAIHLLGSYQLDLAIVRHVFYAPLTVGLEQLELNEGMDMGLATLEDVQQGSLYSSRLGEMRPIGAPHRQILLDFQAKKIKL
ncbi:MAG TPA: NUDIX hydrolase [Allocoleopsis sp.]